MPSNLSFIKKQLSVKQNRDKYEQSYSFLDKVYENSTFISVLERWNTINIQKNGFRSVHDIHSDILNIVKKRGKIDVI